MAPGRLRNWGIESLQRKGTRSWKSARSASFLRPSLSRGWIDLATRSPSWRRISDAATARLLDLIREFDARGGWGNGFRSCGHWLSWRVGLAPGAAREHVRWRGPLGTLPLLGQALARGELSYAKLRALTRVATPETEERLLAVGAQHRRACRAIVRGWRRVVPAGGGPGGCPAAREPGAARVSRQRRHGENQRAADRGGSAPCSCAGAGRPRARRCINRGAPVTRATGAGGRAEETPTMEQQQADALALLAETALHHGIDPALGERRYLVVVHVDAEVLADADAPGQSVLDDGARVPAERPSAWRASQPGGDAPRPGWPGGGGRCSDPDDSSGATAGAPPSRPRLPLPGLWSSARPGPSHPPLATVAHDALESRPALSPAPPRRSRGGLPHRATGPTASSDSGARMAGRCPKCRLRQSWRTTPSNVLRARHEAQGAPASRQDGVPDLAGGTPGRGLGDRRLPPVGGSDTE